MRTKNQMGGVVKLVVPGEASGFGAMVATGLALGVACVI